MVCNWRKVILIGLVALLIPVKTEDIDECKAGEWRCGDTSCAGVGAMCDGALHCEDGSDEALQLCRGTKRPLLGLLLLCLEPWARAQATLCPEACRKWPDYCYYALSAEHGEPGTCILPPFPSVGSYSITDVTPRGVGPVDFSLTYSCPSGYRLLGKTPRCVSGVWSAGFPSCILASSPAVSAVYAGEKHGCSEHQFSCADGACVGRERRCDGAPDCADGSDERACADDPTTEMCVLPEYPKHGTYSVLNQPFAAPGQAFATATLVVTCDPGFEVMGSSPYCFFGAWSNDEMPHCSQCGTVVPNRAQFSINGSYAKRGEMPWHAGIYEKTSTPYRQICGGSLVSTTVVLSAAHCFWDPALMSTSPNNKYAVALGKIFRPWDEAMDFGAHKSDVKSIKIPVHFRGVATNYQDDISLVVLSTPVVYGIYIRPVCLDFSVELDRSQLDTSLGKVAGWGLTSEDGPPSPLLKTKELLHVDLRRCIEDSPEAYYRNFVTSDKICADAIKGTIICQGDSGGGLAFPTMDSRGTLRYYLRGVVSTAPSSDHLCNVKNHILFTHVLMHEMFIKNLLNNV